MPEQMCKKCETITHHYRLYAGGMKTQIGKSICKECKNIRKCENTE